MLPAANAVMSLLGATNSFYLLLSLLHWLSGYNSLKISLYHQKLLNSSSLWFCCFYSALGMMHFLSFGGAPKDKKSPSTCSQAYVFCAVMFLDPRSPAESSWIEHCPGTLPWWWLSPFPPIALFFPALCWAKYAYPGMDESSVLFTSIHIHLQ